MENELKELQQTALSEINAAPDADALGQFNAKYLGKSGKLSLLMRGLKDVSAEERPKMGQAMNVCRDALIKAIHDREDELESAELNAKLQNETVDVTIPVKPSTYGTMHPLKILQNDLTEYFVKRGYTLRESGEIETDHYCFEALNMPKDHPAREAQDTFYIDDETVLRVHTSATQIRTMESTAPPIKMISAGKVYRVDDLDATHSPMFNQLEILVVDKNVTMSDLKGTLEGFVKFLFGEKTKVRLRTSFFPFTEPSVEVDVSCPNCGQKGCSMCKGTGYIELLGAGMVNPKVLENCGIDSTVYSGFAAGLGLDRIAMIRYGINDIRELYSNDINLLKQFK